MGENNFNIKVLLDKIKEYYTLIIFIPPLLGGIWQIGVLSSISTSYIRFFSVTQLISDGLLILLLIGFIVFSLIITRFFIKMDKRKLKPKWLIGSIYILIGLFLSYVSINDLIIPFFQDKHFSISFLVFFIPMIIIGLSLFIHGLGEVTSFKIFKKAINNIYGDFSTLVDIFSMLFIIYFLNFGWKKFGDTFHVPHDLKNIENVNCYLSNQYNIAKNEYKFLYFNDKFIFIENTRTDSVKQNIVINVEEMFNRSNCKPL